MPYGMMSLGGWVWMILIPLLLIGIIVMVFFKLMDKSKEDTDNRNQSDSPLEILKKRLARGDISEEDYKRIKDTLERD